MSASAPIRLTHGFNLFVAAVWLALLIPPFRGASLIGSLVVFLAVPLVMLIAWRKSRRTGVTVPLGYHLGSRVFWMFSWLASCVPVLFVVAIYQPWPLNLRYGPDTSFSLGHFDRLYGADRPALVEGVYYQHHGLRDGTTFMRFGTPERAVAERMAARLYLEPTEVGPVTVGLGDWQPPWWLDIRPEAEWAGTDGWTRMWYDGELGVALYRSVSF